MRLNEDFRSFLIILAAVLIPIILVWIPFFFRIPTFWGINLPQSGMATVIANYDGPYYIVVAKSLYQKEEIAKFQFPLPDEYYAAHFPAFPLAIRTLSPIFGYPWAMMLVTVISSFAALWFFFLLLRQVGLEKVALWLTLVFAIFPARWLIVRSIGSPEPLFIAAILASFYFLLRKNYWAMGIAGAVAMLTKSPGIILFLALSASIIAPQLRSLFVQPLATARKLLVFLLPLLLIPATALLIFFWYSRAYGDFFAYFHSGDNIHLLFPPFQVFNTGATWVGTFWLEEIIWLYLFGFLGIFSTLGGSASGGQLIKEARLPFALFIGIFFISTLFVSHRDIARYILPIVPFLIIAFANILNSQPFKWALVFLIIPIYLFALNFIIGNATPIADWGPLL